MTMTQSPLAYADIIAVFNEALDSERGVRVRTKTAGAAKHLRQRMYSCRVISRRANAKIYEPGHPMHGASEYDILEFVLEEDSVKVVKISARQLETEVL